MADLAAPIAHCRRARDFLPAYPTPEQVGFHYEQAFWVRETRDRVSLALDLAIKMPVRKQDLRDVPDEDVPIANAAVSPVPPSVGFV